MLISPRTPSFPGETNDLVVDTDSMVNFGVPNLRGTGSAHATGGPTDQVWHCNYFRQEKTINYLTQNLI